MRRDRALVDLKVAGYRLRAGLWPTVATLLFLPALVSLGIWQLHRAQEKRLLQAEFDRRQNEPPAPFGLYHDPAEQLRFRRVVMHGFYEPKYQILLDNRVEQGQVGYYVLTPLRVEGSDARVLVNRGWVALGSSRQSLPRIDTPAASVDVTGIVTVPDAHGFHLGGVTPSGSGWQPVWEYLDLTEYARRVPFSVQPVVVLLDPDSPAGGFRRQWARLDAGIATHEGYAVQWFALASALVAIYIFVNIRKIRASESENDDE
jgi:surfeit locus 1 family protein